MDDAGRVQVLKSAYDLIDYTHEIGQGHFVQVVRDQRPQVVVEKLGHHKQLQVILRVLLAHHEVKQLRNKRTLHVVERPHQLDLANNLHRVILVFLEVTNHLDGHRPLVPQAMRFVHNAVGTFADELLDAVVGEDRGPKRLV